MGFSDAKERLTSYFVMHSRSWRDNLYVYPVISRRAEGVSIGVNLNPDKACNFDCIYCQVDRSVPPRVRKVDLERLRGELSETLRVAVTGTLFQDPAFREVPASHRVVRDIAFSGDGEPTASPQFLPAVKLAADLRRELGLDQQPAGSPLKIILITDAGYLNRPAVREALAVMDANNGEIWAKLDAGTEKYFRLVNRPNVPLQRILDNILEAARVRPIVIQSLWMKVHGEGPDEAEVAAFAGRLRDIIAGGGKLRLVQIYTVARHTAEAYVTPLSGEELARIAEQVRGSVADVPVAIY